MVFVFCTVRRRSDGISTDNIKIYLTERNMTPMADTFGPRCWAKMPWLYRLGVGRGANSNIETSIAGRPRAETSWKKEEYKSSACNRLYYIRSP